MKKQILTFHSGPPPSILNLQKQLDFDHDTQVEIWSALEALTAPELEIRQQGFENLIELDAVRKSPLTVYVLATRILEPDLALRRRVVRCLAELISPSPHSPPAAGASLTYLYNYLSQMRTRPIFALLQVAKFDSESTSEVSALLKACSFAGTQLAQIISSHSASVPIRRQAIYFISQIGFLAAIPVLERMVKRLEKRPAEDTLRMAIPDQEDELSLLPHMKEALEKLNSI